MAKRRSELAHAEIVKRFAARLRELRLSRGFTQADLGRAAAVTGSYIARLENGGTAPGIDLVERLATALGTTTNDLLPVAAVPDSVSTLQARARKLFEGLVSGADKETLQMLCPLLARLGESPTRKR